MENTSLRARKKERARNKTEKETLTTAGGLSCCHALYTSSVAFRGGESLVHVRFLLARVILETTTSFEFGGRVVEKVNPAVSSDTTTAEKFLRSVYFGNNPDIE